MRNHKNKWLIQWLTGGENLKVGELIEKLTKLQKEHGNLEVVGHNDELLWDVEVQKFILTSCEYNDIITRHTEDLDENYLEKTYKEDENYKQYYVDEGICLKIW